DLVLGAAEVEDALRGRGLARVHVGDDADVAEVVEHGLLAGRGCPIAPGRRGNNTHRREPVVPAKPFRFPAKPKETHVTPSGLSGPRGALRRALPPLERK